LTAVTGNKKNFEERQHFMTNWLISACGQNWDAGVDNLAIY